MHVHSYWLNLEFRMHAAVVSGDLGMGNLTLNTRPLELCGRAQKNFFAVLDCKCSLLKMPPDPGLSQLGFMQDH
eukprot:364268-Chlamydomonas_euryale.AAC.2